ncbi:MAG: hypothetical protein JO069_03605 [Verrucomicrobia bacterium]|nr:hypothetical protein [Verrucomicrobiota bacterium]
MATDRACIAHTFSGARRRRCRPSSATRYWPRSGDHAILDGRRRRRDPLNVRDDKDEHESENFEDREQGSEVDPNLGQPVEHRAFGSDTPGAGRKPKSDAPEAGAENP